jgi:hypothetical protein
MKLDVFSSTRHEGTKEKMNNYIKIELSEEYKSFILEIKNKIKCSQVNIATTVNRSLLFFYWEIRRNDFS